MTQPPPYNSYIDLEANECEGRDYRVRVRRGPSGILVLAPHGGNIEPGCSRIVEAVAGQEHSFYTFEGIKPSGNRRLHIPSTQFDEPRCLSALQDSRSALAIHGCKEQDDIIYVGGLDRILRHRLEGLLQRMEFQLGERPGIQGENPLNVCNLGISGKGVQIEVSFGLRRRMFSDFTPGGEETTPLFRTFVSAVRAALDGY